MEKSILYYPTINIPNTEWLKSTLFYWDKVSSIVPYREFCGFDDTIRILQNYGAYSPIYPDEILRKAGPDFLDRLERRLEGMPRTQRTASIYEEKLVHMHLYNIMDQYQEIKRLFVNAKVGLNGIANINENAVLAYMKTLAELAVEDNDDMAVGTSTQTSMDAWLNADSNLGESRLSFDISLRKCLPALGENSTLEDVLNFKIENHLELIDFQREIDIFRGEIANCVNIQDIQRAKGRFIEKMDRSIELRKTTLLETGKDFVLGSMKVMATTVSCELMNGIPLNELNCEDVLPTMITELVALLGSSICFCFKNSRSRRKTNNFNYVVNARIKGLL